MTTRPRAKRPAWRKFEIDLAKAGEIMRECGVVANGEPIVAAASLDAERRVRRITAHFESGWKATVNIACCGGYTVSQTISMKVVELPRNISPDHSAADGGQGAGDD